MRALLQAGSFYKLAYLLFRSKERNVESLEPCVLP